MKPFFICLIALLFLNNCKNDDDVIPQAQVQEEIILTDNIEAYNTMIGNKNPYGDGTASVQIVNALKSL